MFRAFDLSCCNAHTVCLFEAPGASKQMSFLQPELCVSHKNENCIGLADFLGTIVEYLREKDFTES